MFHYQPSVITEPNVVVISVQTLPIECATLAAVVCTTDLLAALELSQMNNKYTNQYDGCPHTFMLGSV